MNLGDSAEAEPDRQAGVGVQTLLPDDGMFDQALRRLADRGVPARSVSYWLESDVVISVTLKDELSSLTESAAFSSLARTAGGSRV